MGMIRNAWRSLLDHELGVLGGQMDALRERIQDLIEDHTKLSARFHKLQARDSMSVARSHRAVERDDAVGEIRQRFAVGGQQQTQNDFGQPPPEWR